MTFNTNALIVIITMKRPMHRYELSQEKFLS